MLTHVQSFLGLFENKLVAHTHFVATLGLQVIFFLFFNGYWNFRWVISYELTLEKRQIILKVQVILTHVLNAFQVCLRQRLLHMHAWLPHWIMKYFFRTFCFLLFLIFWQVMRCEHTHLSFLRFFHSSNDTWTQFPHFLGWFETKFAAITQFIAIFVLEVLLSHFMNFLVGYEL